MARMMAEVCDALKCAGADEDKVRATATAIAGQWEIEERLDRLEQRVSKVETGVGILKWMVGFTLALQVVTLFFIWQLMLRLPV
jgi:hypothetical protein